MSSGLLQNLDSLKESVRLAGAGNYDWQNIDMTQFQGIDFYLIVSAAILFVSAVKVLSFII